MHQLVLRPADQRRHEQRCERQVVLRLQDEAHRGEQILHRQRCVQPQPVDARDRHTFGIQARDDQRGKVATPLDEDHHILGPQGPPLALQHQAAVQPVAHRACDPHRLFADGIVDPRFLVRFAATCDHQRPQLDRTRAGHLARMRLHRVDRAEAGLARRGHGGIDEL